MKSKWETAKEHKCKHAIYYLQRHAETRGWRVAERSLYTGRLTVFKMFKSVANHQDMTERERAYHYWESLEATIFEFDN